MVCTALESTVLLDRYALTTAGGLRRVSKVESDGVRERVGEVREKERGGEREVERGGERWRVMEWKRELEKWEKWERWREVEKGGEWWSERESWRSERKGDRWREVERGGERWREVEIWRVMEIAVLPVNDWPSDFRHA
jgi:hypothetical protein